MNEPKEKINYDDFVKLDIRVGTIVSAEKVPDADKLLLLHIDIGEESPRKLVAGIAEYKKEEALVGKQVTILANLLPRTIRGVESDGMMLVASFDGGISLLHPESPVPPGTRVK